MRNWRLIAGLAVLVAMLAPADARAEGESQLFTIRGVSFGLPNADYPHYHLAIKMEWNHEKGGKLVAANANGVGIPKVPVSPHTLYSLFKDGKPVGVLERGGVMEMRVHYIWGDGEKVELDVVAAPGDSKTNLTAKYTATAPGDGTACPRADWFDTKVLFVSEDAGLDRTRELVDLTMAFESKVVRNPATDIQIFSLAPETGKPTPVPFQAYQVSAEWKYNGSPRLAYLFDDTVSCRLVFPADVPARQTRLFAVSYGPPEGQRPTEPLVKNTGSDLVVTKGAGQGYTVSNSLYAAVLSERCGQISNIVHRGSARPLHGDSGSRYHTWHWGPDVCLYVGEGTNGALIWPHAHEWDPAPRLETTEGPLFFELRRSGPMPRVLSSKTGKKEGDLPEVNLELTYRFYAWAPYILITSRFIFKEDVLVDHLRADATMFPRESDYYAWREAGQTKIKQLGMHSARLAYDTPWFGVYDSKSGEGVANLLLNISNVGPAGQKAVERCAGVYIYKEHWMRAAIYDFRSRQAKHEKDPKQSFAGSHIHYYMTAVPKGSEYVDRMAYLMFRYDEKNKCKEMEDWYAKLTNPLRVLYEQ